MSTQTDQAPAVSAEAAEQAERIVTAIHAYTCDHADRPCGEYKTDLAIVTREVNAIHSAMETALRLELAHCEERYVAALNAVLANTGCVHSARPDIDRWRGHIEAWGQEARRLYAALGEEPPDYDNAWRAAHGVYSNERVEQWNRTAARDCRDCEREEQAEIAHTETQAAADPKDWDDVHNPAGGSDDLD